MQADARCSVRNAQLNLGRRRKLVGDDPLVCQTSDSVFTNLNRHKVSAGEKCAVNNASRIASKQEGLGKRRSDKA